MPREIIREAKPKIVKREARSNSWCIGCNERWFIGQKMIEVIGERGTNAKGKDKPENYCTGCQKYAILNNPPQAKAA